MSMIKHPKFVRAWPVLAAAGTFLLPMLCAAILSGDITMLGPRAFWNLLLAYPYALFTVLGLVYFCFTVPLMIGAFRHWLKEPCGDTLFWTMLFAWVICGYPGLYFVFIYSFGGFGNP